MPLAAKYQAKESWDETTLAGKTIAVPSNVAQPQGKIVAVRQVLMEKYDMTELKNWDDYKQYMLTIAEKETPESGIYALAASGDNNELWDVYRQQTNTMLALDSNYMDFIYEYKEGELPSADDIKFVYEYEPFKEYANDMKEMADAGCWSRSALTNTVTDDDAFGALQGASIAWNASAFTRLSVVRSYAIHSTPSDFSAAWAVKNGDLTEAGTPERELAITDAWKERVVSNPTITFVFDDANIKPYEDAVISCNT